MNDHSAHSDRLLDLVGAVCDNSASSDDFVELDSTVRADQRARDLYLGYCQLHGALRLESRAHRAIQSACQQITITPSIAKSIALDIGELAPPATPAPILPANFWHGVHGHFSSDMPIAYLVATIILFAGLATMAIIPVSQPTQVAIQSQTATEQQRIVAQKEGIVGWITGMVDCKWTGSGKGTIVGAAVSVGQKCVLDSGLMEITYETGAKVILQGPVTYEVESAAGGYLAVGKLTAKLEKNAKCGVRSTEKATGESSAIPSFAVRTPTAIVTDLGTEFGVEVSKDGKTFSHVFQGAVEVRKASATGTQTAPVRLVAEQSVVVERQGTDSISINAGKGGEAKFVRSSEMAKIISGKSAAKVGTPPLLWPIMDKTIVAWVSLDNLDQRSVGVFSIVDMPEFDGIVFNELGPKKWMAGSYWWHRTQQDQSAYPAEIAKPGELVCVAIVYNWTNITIYRNGVQYAQYDVDYRKAFQKESVLLIGKRHLDDTPQHLPTLAGAVEEVRLYNTALSAEAVAAMKPNIPSPIGPIGCWTFEDGTTKDSTKHFPPGVLHGKARIAAGKLILDGKDSYLAVPAVGSQLEKPLPASEPATPFVDLPSGTKHQTP